MKKRTLWGASDCPLATSSTPWDSHPDDEAPKPRPFARMYRDGTELQCGHKKNQQGRSLFSFSSPERPKISRNVGMNSSRKFGLYMNATAPDARHSSRNCGDSS